MKILQTELETEHLRLTRPYLTDAQAMYEALSDPSVFRYNAWERHRSPVETFAFVNNLMLRYENGDAEWVVREKDRDDAIGIICLRENGENSAEIGFWLNGKYHGRGYGSEIVEKIVKFGFEECKIKKIEAYCHPKNGVSIHILMKNGFFKESEVENNFKSEDFEKTPVLLKLSAFS